VFAEALETYLGQLIGSGHVPLKYVIHNEVIPAPDENLNVPMEPEAERPEADAFTPEMYDTLISAEVLLPKGDILVPAKVIGRKRNPCTSKSYWKKKE
jgi:hypothetical protein